MCRQAFESKEGFIGTADEIENMRVV